MEYLGISKCMLPSMSTCIHSYFLGEKTRKPATIIKSQQKQQTAVMDFQELLILELFTQIINVLNY